MTGALRPDDSVVHENVMGPVGQRVHQARTTDYRCVIILVAGGWACMANWANLYICILYLLPKDFTPYKLTLSF